MSLDPTVTTTTAPAMIDAASAAAADLAASGRVLARLAQAMAVALVAMERDRVRPKRGRLHRV